MPVQVTHQGSLSGEVTFEPTAEWGTRGDCGGQRHWRGEAGGAKTLHVRGRGRRSVSWITANTSANTAPRKPWGWMNAKVKSKNGNSEQAQTQKYCWSTSLFMCVILRDKSISKCEVNPKNADTHCAVHSCVRARRQKERCALETDPVRTLIESYCPPGPSQTWRHSNRKHVKIYNRQSISLLLRHLCIQSMRHYRLGSCRSFHFKKLTY